MLSQSNPKNCINYTMIQFLITASIDHRKLPMICFYNNMGKGCMELALCSIEKACVLHLTSFLLSVLLQTIATRQSLCKNFDSYCKNGFGTSMDVIKQLQF